MTDIDRCPHFSSSRALESPGLARDLVVVVSAGTVNARLVFDLWVANRVLNYWPRELLPGMRGGLCITKRQFQFRKAGEASLE